MEKHRQHYNIDWMDNNTLYFYADRAVEEMGAGVGVVRYRGKREIEARRFGLGKRMELLDMELFALARETEAGLRHYNPLTNRFLIFTDSQRAISRIEDNRTGSGQQWKSEIESGAEKYKQGGVKVEIIWVPGHTGTREKDRAEQLAKDGEHNRSVHLGAVTTRNHIKTVICKTPHNEWTEQWDQMKKGRNYSGMPKLNIPKEMRYEKQSIISTIIQMRTGHCHTK